MIVLTLPRVAATVLTIFLSSMALGAELEDREAIKSEVKSLVDNEQFSQLEALADRYRTSRSRTSSGLWHLTLFQVGIANAFSSRNGGYAYWSSAERRAQKWVSEFPNSPTARLAYATMLFNRAISYSAKAKKSGLQSYNRTMKHLYINAAGAYLAYNKDVAAQDPRWYELMIYVSAWQSNPETDVLGLISEALEREPQFYQTYFAAIDYFARFRNSGVATIEGIARLAAESTKHSHGFGMYARIYWYASQVVFGDRIFLDSMVDWPTMKAGIDDVLAEYPDNWNLNNFAKLACLARDKAKTAEIFARIDEGAIDVVWGSRSAFQRCRDWSSGRNSPPDTASRPISYSED